MSKATTTVLIWMWESLSLSLLTQNFKHWILQKTTTLTDALHLTKEPWAAVLRQKDRVCIYHRKHWAGGHRWATLLFLIIWQQMNLRSLSSLPVMCKWQVSSLMRTFLRQSQFLSTHRLKSYKKLMHQTRNPKSSCCGHFPKDMPELWLWTWIWSWAQNWEGFGDGE